MEMYYDLNADAGRRALLDLHPENRDPTGSRRRRCRRRSCGRIAATRTSACAATPVRPKYHSFQLQVNRRYIQGVQFGGVLHAGSAHAAWPTRIPAICRSRSTGRSTYYYDVARAQPDAQLRRSTTPGTFRADDSGAAAISARTAGSSRDRTRWVSGEWAPVLIHDARQLRFHRRRRRPGHGSRRRVPRSSGRIVVGDPMAGGGDPLTGWFNAAAFKRPSGRGDYGNAPRNAVQRPGINNWNLAIFKNFAAGGTAGVPVPLRDLQRPEHGAVHRHRSRRGVQRAGRADEGDVRHGARHHHADRAAAVDPVVGAVHVLEACMKRIAWIVSRSGLRSSWRAASPQP